MLLLGRVISGLLLALALQIKLNGTGPIAPLHIAGEENSMPDIPLHSFGSKQKQKTEKPTMIYQPCSTTYFPFPTRHLGPS